MELLQIGLIFLGGFPILATAFLSYQIMRNGQGAIGKPTITAWLFYTTKFFIGFLLGCVFLASIQPDFFHHFPWLIQNQIPEVQKLLSLIFLFAGNLLLIPAYYSLSIFTRVGLPTKEHALQTEGVYKISRNPMYTSFFFFFAACFLLIPSLIVALVIVFNLVAHHFIILNEERFLETTFTQEYLKYKKNTARYL